MQITLDAPTEAQQSHPCTLPLIYEQATSAVSNRRATIRAHGYISQTELALEAQRSRIVSGCSIFVVKIIMMKQITSHSRLKEIATLLSKPIEQALNTPRGSGKSSTKDKQSQSKDSSPITSLAPSTLAVEGLVGSSVALVLAQLQQTRPLLCIMDDADTAGYLFADLEQLLGSDTVQLFPSAWKRAIKYGHRDEAGALARSMVLTALASAEGNDLPIIITYPEALAEGVAASTEVASEHLTISRGMTIERQLITTQLLDWGYERCDYVYEPGQFAVRGSIFDIYSYADERPYRLDFWDDELESIRSFEVESQLSVGQLEHITLVPDLGSQATALGTSLIEIIPAETLIVTSDGTYMHERIRLVWEDEPRVSDEEGFADIEALRERLISPERCHTLIDAHQHLYLHSTGDSTERLSLMPTAEMAPQPLIAKDYDLLCQYLGQWQLDDYHIYIASASSSQWERICEIITEHAPHLRLPERLDITLHEGFVAPALRVALLTEHQIFGRFHKYSLRSDRARSGKITLSLRELSTFHPGDLVVHTDHGIGRFGGLITMVNGDRTQEVVKIEYERGDTIFVGLHSLHKLSHYRQRDAAESVKLSTLGTSAWARLRDKTKRQVKDIARDLIRLYAQRREAEGFAFSPDSYLQHELEASFAYEPTPDQIRATEDIKADMERAYPMDRLLCGDVGFGKTEVAIRAAFKAASDSKQVAVLVPTTVLAYQHYRTFSERLEGMPVRVEYLSRARSPKETKAILQDLAEGRIDIIVGTHKLTGRDVRFRDLGLLIIDEEQKFGVAVKERLRKMQVSVDTLTMSATPIPRTLQFSLMGARDLSNINTPPANRVPVETILDRFSSDTIREAVNFELSRNGQIFIIHNRIQNIEEIAAVVRREVPDARIAIGHGQMSPSELEQILIDFTRHDYDVLISTTIIENGIDVPNANTIIINDAHRYGLSELHQLRGRVGRSDRKAFCYLLTPPLATLTDEARRRVRAIENFSDLGSGVRIALQDLDIRGAGNALGAEQSGFISDMGYETYQKVFNEAISELKATEFAELYASESSSLSAEHFVAETTVESDLELSLPEDYVPSDAERIILYRELDNLSSDSELDAYAERLRDRFGTLPEVARELISVPRLRRLGRNLGVEKIILRGGNMSFHLPAQETTSAYYQGEVFGSILNFVARHAQRCEFRQRGSRHIIGFMDVPSIDEAITLCHSIIAEK